MIKSIKDNWFSNVRGDLLAGIVVALALIPEAIAFSIIAGVDPKVGLYASFCIAVIIAFVGGRPGMISAATGAMALLMVTLVKEHGLQYLLAATLLTGVIQIAAGYLKLGGLMRFVSRSVVTGFVNALAILIFMAQLPELTNVTWHVYAMTAAGLAIIYLFPLIPTVGKLIPSPLVCIVGLTIVSMVMGLDIRTVGDMGELPDTLPIFLWPDVPLTLETLMIILPYSIPLAIVGLLESMMTATIVDDLTDTTSDRNRECKGQGIANIGSGLIGGMAGCAMIWKCDWYHRAAAPVVGYSIIGFFGPVVSLIISIGMANVAGNTKKSFMAATIFVAYCVGNIVGPQLIKSQTKSRHYPELWLGLIICYRITIVSAVVLYFVLARENKRREALDLNDVDRDKMAFQDLTDKENPYFKYML